MATQDNTPKYKYLCDNPSCNLHCLIHMKQTAGEIEKTCHFVDGFGLRLNKEHREATLVEYKGKKLLFCEKCIIAVNLALNLLEVNYATNTGRKTKEIAQIDGEPIELEELNHS